MNFRKFCEKNMHLLFQAVLKESKKLIFLVVIFSFVFLPVYCTKVQYDHLSGTKINYFKAKKWPGKKLCKLIFLDSLPVVCAYRY